MYLNRQIYIREQFLCDQRILRMEILVSVFHTVSDTALRGRNLRCHLLQAVIGEEKTFYFCTFLF